MRPDVTATSTNNLPVPGFLTICRTDAYLFKLCFVFLPVPLLVLLYGLVQGRPVQDMALPGLFSALLLACASCRWYVIAATFKDHEVLSCRITSVLPGGGLLGLQVYVRFVETGGGDESSGRGAFLARGNPRAARLGVNDAVTVLWNRKSTYIIKEAYVDA